MALQPVGRDQEPSTFPVERRERGVQQRAEDGAPRRARRRALPTPARCPSARRRRVESGRGRRPRPRRPDSPGRARSRPRRRGPPPSPPGSRSTPSAGRCAPRRAIFGSSGSGTGIARRSIGSPARHPLDQAALATPKRCRRGPRASRAPRRAGAAAPGTRRAGAAAAGSPGKQPRREHARRRARSSDRRPGADSSGRTSSGCAPPARDRRSRTRARAPARPARAAAPRTRPGG